jgi:hypothetical protein
MRFSIEAFVQSDNILVPRTLKDVVLLHDLFQRALIGHVGLVDRFEGDKLARQPIDSQIYLAKGSFADDFSDLVVVDLGVIYPILYVRQDIVQDQLPRGQRATVTHHLLDDAGGLLCFGGRGLILAHLAPLLGVHFVVTLLSLDPLLLAVVVLGLL